MRLIDADELIKNIPNEEMISKYAVAHAPTIDKFEIAKEALIEAIDNAETVGGVVENIIDRPQGKWLLSDLQSQADNDNGNYAYVCTNCNHTDIHAKTQKVPYCWWCGAHMKGADGTQEL